MSKTTKLLLGGATLLPFLYMIFFFIVIFSFILFNSQGEASPEPGPPALLLLIFPLHMLAMMLVFGLTIFYIINVFRNERVEKDKKALWAVVIFLGNMIAMPIYWYLYIWKETPRR
jgi:energy-coupling factor transporter transmembrane protein EcfT